MKRPLLLWALLAVAATLGLDSPVQGAPAQTHTMTSTGGYWSIKVIPLGKDMQCWGDIADFKATPSDTPSRRILYTSPNTFKVRYEITQITGDEIRDVAIGGNPGTSWTETYEFPAGGSTMKGFSEFLYVSPPPITGKLVGHDAGTGEEILYDVYDTAPAGIDVFKPLQIDLTYGGNREDVSLIASQAIPYFRWVEDAGHHRIDFTRTRCPNVNVKIQGTGAISFDPSSGVTDENGLVKLAVTASRKSDPEATKTGWVTGPFVATGEVGQVKLTVNDSLQIHYATVKSVRGCRIATANGMGGYETGEVLYAGYWLTEGQSIQIGGYDVPMESHVTVQFCDGYEVFLQASPFLGYHATISDGDVSSKPSLLYVDLKDLSYKISNDPRRFLRIAVIKAFAEVADDLIPFPELPEVPRVQDDGTVEIWSPNVDVGGSVEKFLMELTGTQPYSSSQSLLSTSVNGSQALVSPVAYAASASIGEAARAVSASLDVYADGSVLVENNGGVARVSSGTMSAAVFPGAGRLFRVADGQFAASDPGVLTDAFRIAAPDEPVFSPAPGSTNVSGRPALSISGIDPAKVTLETLAVRLDGRFVGNYFNFFGTTLSGSVAPLYPLADGEHVLSLECRAKNGTTLLRESRFTVSSAPEPPAYIDAAAAAEQNSVYWGAVGGATSYKVWRSETADGAKTLLKNPTQPLCLDTAPPTVGFYWVEAVGAAGTGSELVGPVEVNRAEAVGVPAAAGISGFSAAATARGIRIDFDEGQHGHTLWKVERSASASGPFVRLAPDEDSITPGWVDASADLTVTQYYRLVACDLSGAESVSGPVAVPASPLPLAAPGGLDVVTSEGHPLVRWNRVGDVRVTGLRLYRNTGSGFILITSPGIGDVEFADHTAPSDRECVYQISAVSAAGEGALSPQITYAEHIRPTEPSTIELVAPSKTFAECDGEAVLEARRTGNLGEPAFLQIYADGASGDYTPPPSLVEFAKGQSSALIHIPITADALWERSESFQLQATSALGSAILGSSRWVTFSITDDNDILYFATTWDRVAETDGVYRLVIERLWPSTRSVSVDVVPDPALTTALAGKDYTSVFPLRVNFGPNETTKTVNIALANDTEKDGWKVLQLSLTNALGGAAADSSALELSIRDDETLTGQIKSGESSPVIFAKGTSITIPFVRVGGSDGPLNAFVEPRGGPLGWDGITVNNGSLRLQEGETSGNIQVDLNTESAESRVGRFCVLNFANMDYPYQNNSVIVVFPPADPNAPGFNEWRAEHQLQEGSARSDADRDGRSDLVEYAQGTDPLSNDRPPADTFEVDPNGYATFRTRVAARPDAVVYAEVSDNLNWTNTRMVGGNWQWNEEAGAFDVNFNLTMDGPQIRLFTRLKVIRP